MDATNKTKTPATTTLLATPVGSSPEAVTRHVGRAYPGLVRPHAFYSSPSSTDPEHPIGTAIGGPLVPPISRSAWLYVESVYRNVLTAYLANGTSPVNREPEKPDRVC